MQTRAQIVIVGAGVAGASIAWHLAERGCTDVLVLDRAEPTSGSTFHSAGLVGQLRSSLPLTRMMMHSVDMYRRLEAEAEATGRSPGWREVGSLRIASTDRRGWKSSGASTGGRRRSVSRWSSCRRARRTSASR